MACRLAENEPLMKLRHDLGLPKQCHSLRKNCVHGHPSRKGAFAMGIPGAVIGYCQALFNYDGAPDRHTEKLIEILESLGAPWARSHELFWGFRKDEPVSTYIQQAFTPLLGSGRVPILITTLDPALDSLILREIFDTSLSTFPNETVLVRVVLSNDDSIKATVRLIQDILTICRQSRTMPQWWPLLQGDLSIGQWAQLRAALGKDWDYVNLAVNPWTFQRVIEFDKKQITVAQFAVGLDSGIQSDGNISIPPGMKLPGAKECDGYSIFDYTRALSNLSVCPTLIVLGPSSPEWTLEQNISRIKRFVPLLKAAADILWRELSQEEREAVLLMSA